MAKKKAKPKALTRKKASLAVPSKQLVGDLRQSIERTRALVAVTVNAALVILYWNIGKRIREDVLANERAGYGEEIVQTLSAQLTEEYGRGFGRRNLFQMVRFAEVFPDEQVVQTLSRQLSWSHFVEIVPLDDSLKRDFYAEMCRVERWSVRTLRQKIDRLLFERTAVSKKPAALIERDLAALRDEDRLTPDLVFRDPYFLDFLGLTGAYDEKDIETSVIQSAKNQSTLRPKAPQFRRGWGFQPQQTRR